MASNKRKQKTKILSTGRPPSVKKSRAALSASATRTLIRSHHRLHKELHRAIAEKNDTQAQQLQHEIDALGGLKSYQQASILGQARERGGDSSTVLMQWLRPVLARLKDRQPRLHLLEVGALSTTNACSRVNAFDIERIDLNSQGVGIIQQDFMQRPLPKQAKEKFNIISLSLVLNYVPDPVQRGEMLKRTCQFLQSSDDVDATFPALFLVLPAPCIRNSRYLDDHRFTEIMESLGYRLIHNKQTAKLVYQLWHLTGDASGVTVPKLEVNPGSARNNFTIILK